LENRNETGLKAMNRKLDKSTSYGIGAALIH